MAIAASSKKSRLSSLPLQAPAGVVAGGPVSSGGGVPPAGSGGAGGPVGGGGGVPGGAWGLGAPAGPVGCVPGPGVVSGGEGPPLQAARIAPIVTIAAKVSGGWGDRAERGSARPARAPSTP